MGAHGNELEEREVQVDLAKRLSIGDFSSIIHNLVVKGKEFWEKYKEPLIKSITTCYKKFHNGKDLDKRSLELESDFDELAKRALHLSQDTTLRHEKRFFGLAIKIGKFLLKVGKKCLKPAMKFFKEHAADMSSTASSTG